MSGDYSPTDDELRELVQLSNMLENGEQISDLARLVLREREELRRAAEHIAEDDEDTRLVCAQRDKAEAELASWIKVLCESTDRIDNLAYQRDTEKAAGDYWEERAKKAEADLTAAQAAIGRVEALCVDENAYGDPQAACRNFVRDLIRAALLAHLR